MSVATRLAQAARGNFARLVAVIAIFAGLVLAHGMECGSTMDATVPGHVCAGGVMHDNDGRAAAGMVHDPARAGIGTRTSTDPGAPTARIPRSSSAS